MQGLKILVVEDEPAVLELVTLVLRRAGFAVIACSSGAEAVAAFRKRHDTVAAVLLDVQMHPLDGPQTLSLLRGINPGLPCVFMSGSTGRYDAQDLSDMSGCSVLQKPFRLAELEDAVAQAVLAVAHRNQ